MAINANIQSMRSPLDLSIQIKLVIAVLSGLGLAIALATFLVSTAINQFENTISESRLLEENQLTVSHFAQQESELIEIASLVAANEILGTAVAIEDHPSINAMAATFRVQHDLDYVVVADKQNQPMVRRMQNTGIKESQLLEQTLPQIENTALLLTNKGWLLTATMPVVDPVGVIGTITIGRIIDDELLAEVNINRSSPIIHIHGPDGRVLTTNTHANYPDEYGRGVTSLEEHGSVDLKLWQQALAGETGQTIEIEGGIPHRVIYAPLKINNAIVAVYSLEISTANIRALEQQLNIQTLFVLLGAGILIAALLYILMRRFIANPLIALGAAAKEIGDGNLDAPLPPANGDEIGQLTTSFGIMVNQLRQSFATLEERVAERTTDLTVANKQLQQEIAERTLAEEELERFAARLRTVAAISKQINTILEPESLLSEVVTQLQTHFKLYHVHIYLLDESTDTLIMRSGSGSVGAQLREQGHTIALDYEASLVAQAARSREIILANDVSIEPNFMRNPLLPDTKAEVAVPLISSGNVLGVFDVQDNRVHRFKQVDLDTFSTLSGHIANALENAHLFAERKKAEEALILARDQALKASQLKSELVAKVSHELRTPLGAILGYTELLNNGVFGSVSNQQQEIATNVIENTNYLANMVNELLDQAQLDAGKMKLSLHSINPAEIVEDTVSQMNVLAQSKGLSLVVNINPNTPANVIGDPDRIQQILVNLVSNAIKFTEQGGVEVNLYQSDKKHWALQVIDTGCGIPIEAQEYIFEPFEQVDGSETREQKGTGLGLSIVKQLISLMDGQISLQSIVGKGTKFTIQFPLTSTLETTNHDKSVSFDY